MPTVQSTYPETIRPAVAGHQASTRPATMVSRTVEVDFAFGLAAEQGTVADRTVQIADGSTTATAFVGIAVRERSLDANEPDHFKEGETGRFMTLGDIWVTAAAAVNAGDPVHTIAAGALSNTGGVAIVGARWATSTTGGGQLAIVEMK